MTRLLRRHPAVLWWLADDLALRPPARSAIADPADDVLVSAASLWEAAAKRALGKLQAPEDLPAILDEEGFLRLPVTTDHARAVRSLPLSTAIRSIAC